MSNASQANEIAQKWLSDFSNAVTSGDVEAVAQTFLPQGWLRDVLTFTWDIRALEGREKIKSYLSNTLVPAQISNIKLDNTPHFLPTFSVFSPKDGPGIEAAFTFETPIAQGRGYFRLLKDTDAKWKSWATCLILDELKGHEEAGFESGIYEGHTAAWGDILADRRAKIEKDPYVLIVGAGQTGLILAARFKQMGIPALVIDRNARVGDNWRKRYPTLALHTPKIHHSMLYQPYPSNWPLYTPRDKIADWLETYALNQDLVVWTNSQIQGRPKYNEDTGKWEIVIDHDNTVRTIYPSHVVVATGTLGAKPFVGKKVVVVGAGNTSIDICQDLCTHKAASITMIQRSSSVVVSSPNVTKHIFEDWAPGVPVEVGDFKFGTVPFGLRKKVMQGLQAEMWKEEEELHAKLGEKGVSLWMGPEGEGQFIMVYGRGGGLDVGGADLIASGDIKVKQGVEPVAFKEKTLVFSDGSELEADVVIMATGYRKMREVNTDLFGEDVINRTSQVAGYDEEGELRGAYRPSGHPGLWFAVADFWTTRMYSKHLAIQLKAIELGLRKGPQ
ncbi:unnamed protein product [Somion occarium]|uniref:Flavin-containing monooxygenase n=1 Tax=Somion occarium TaxID=3059160 RepID=A0ABP1DKY5_9APHY